MTMAMISPSRREVSPVEYLHRSPRLVPPHGGGVSSRKLSYDFFLNEGLHIAEDGHRGAHEVGGAPRGVGHAPTLVGRVWPPWRTFCGRYFLCILKTSSVMFRDFWSCAE